MNEPTDEEVREYEWLYQWCEENGHLYTPVRSWAGRETGGEEWECKRCGDIHTVTYY